MDSLDQLIANHPFLKGLKPAQLETLSECAMQVHFPAGEYLFREGDPANRFYLILKGCIRLEAAIPGKEPTAVETVGDGNVVGWSWLFPPFVWHFDARALEPTDAIFLYGSRIRERCNEDPILGYELMKRTAEVLINRLQATRRLWILRK